MVAYSFKKQFREPILAGTKRQTIRADRKRHAAPGEELQLYTGMRTRQCAIIARTICLGIQPVTIGVSFSGFVETAEKATDDAEDLEAFALSDGFASWAAMVTFWQREHPDVPVFSGFLIGWGDLLPAPSDEEPF